MTKGAARTLGRRLALQFLFGIDYLDGSLEEALTAFWMMDPVGLTVRNCEPEAGGPARNPQVFSNIVRKEARQYADQLVHGVHQHLTSLDTEISQTLDHWKPGRVGRIEWGILRIALYEMRHAPKVPAPVVIDEAQNLADCFGDVDTPRFVSGVLNRLLESSPDTAAPEA